MARLRGCSEPDSGRFRPGTSETRYGPLIGATDTARPPGSAGCSARTSEAPALRYARASPSGFESACGQLSARKSGTEERIFLISGARAPLRRLKQGRAVIVKHRYRGGRGGTEIVIYWTGMILSRGARTPGSLHANRGTLAAQEAFSLSTKPPIRRSFPRQRPRLIFAWPQWMVASCGSCDPSANIALACTAW